MKAAKPGEKGAGKLVVNGAAVPLDGHNGSNAEKYGTYRENEFRSPLVARALDLLRRREHRVVLQRPPVPQRRADSRRKDAVFLAEFINYFPYNYAEPKGDDPVDVQRRNGPVPVEPQAHLVRIGVQGDAACRPTRCRRATSSSSSTPPARWRREPPAARQASRSRPARRAARREGPRQHRDLRRR